MKKSLITRYRLIFAIAVAFFAIAIAFFARRDDGLARRAFQELPFTLVEEDSARTYFDSLCVSTPITSGDILVLPLFTDGVVEGKRFDYAIARPFLFRNGEPLQVPGQTPSDGRRLRCLMIVPGYWPTSPNQTFFYTKVINESETVYSPILRARTKAEAMKILTAFQELTLRNEIVVTDPLKLLTLPDEWSKAVVDEVGTATEYESYMRLLYGHGGSFLVWGLNQRTRVKLIFSSKDRLLLKSFFDRALHQAETEPGPPSERSMSQ